MHSKGLLAEVDAKASKTKTNREYWDVQFDDIHRFILPRGSSFNRHYSKGANRHHHIFDGAGIWALQQFANGLHAFNTSDSYEWFGLSPREDELANDDEIIEILQRAKRIIFREYQKPESGFGLALPENYYELGAYGTSVLYQDYDDEDGHLIFRAYSLAHCSIDENYKGLVDECYRECEFSTKQLIQQFGEDELPKEVLRADEGESWKVIHAVIPGNSRSVRDYSNRFMNKKFASIYYLEQFKDDDSKGILEIKGYDQFPYHIPRWTKLAGEVYGRSQGMLAVHDVRMLQKMKLTTIEAAEKTVNPPIVVNQAQVISEPSLGTGDIVFINNMGSGGGKAFEPAFLVGDVNLGREMIEDVKESIYRAFYVDQLIRQRKKERQTAFEIADERNEALRQMSPMIGRIQRELFSPMIKRSIYLLEKAGKLPELPEGLSYGDLDIHYTSPAARAQKMAGLESTQILLQLASQMAQFDQEVVDIIDSSGGLKRVGKDLDVPRELIRSDREVRAIKQNREQQQQAMMNSQMQAEQASASKDLAAAQQIQAETQF